jgi:hypothetical protein
LARGSQLWKAGAAGDRGFLDSTRLLDLEASLRREQRRLPEALALLDRALGSEPGRRSDRAAAPHQGHDTLRSELGDHAAAIAELRRAAPLLGTEAEPRLALVLRFNPVENLCHVGRAREAEQLFAEMALVDRARLRGAGNRRGAFERPPRRGRP